MWMKIEGWRGLVLVKINLWTVGAPDLLLAKVSHSHHLVQTFQTNLSSISNTNHHLCVSEGGNSLALRPARANSAIWTDDRMYLTYHQKYSPPKINSSEMFKYSVKKKRFWNPELHTPDLIDIGQTQRGSYSMSKTAIKKKIRRAIKNGVKRWHSNGWNAIFSKQYTSHTI